MGNLTDGGDLGPLFSNKDPMFYNADGSERTVRQAQEQFRAELREGTVCPCCDRYGKIHRRKLNSGIARVLIGLYRLDRMAAGEWIHVPTRIDYRSGGSDYGILEFWGLIERRGDVKEDGNPSSGYYRITPAGIAFAKREVKVVRHLSFYNDAIVEDDEKSEDVDIREALGDKFNYEELMNA